MKKAGYRSLGKFGSMVLLGGLLGLPAAVAAAAFDRGQALYENHCQECHESWAHTRKGHQVTTPEGLRKRVAAWSIHSGLDWSEEEIDDVSDYLGKHYYKFMDRD